MKTRKIFPSLVGLGALTIALCLNFIHASDDYGISSNNLSIEVLAQMNRPDNGDNGTGTGTDKQKAYLYEEKSQDKTTTSCNGQTHETVKQKGYLVSCEGSGNVECKNKSGWYPTEAPSGAVTSICPAVSGEQCQISQ